MITHSFIFYMFGRSLSRQGKQTTHAIVYWYGQTLEKSMYGYVPLSSIEPYTGRTGLALNQTAIEQLREDFIKKPAERRRGDVDFVEVLDSTIEAADDVEESLELRPSTAAPLSSMGPASHYSDAAAAAAAAAAAGSASKYSAARVRERFAHDGTVAPVTTPKKTQEGLYQRPAGRTRKGMEWDAVRGVWVPNDKSMAYYFY